MTQEKHTPLPWAYMKVEKTYTAHDGQCVTVATVYQGEKAIARCHNVEDAFFIVRACNSHYELLEVLKRTANTLEAYMRDAGDMDDPTLRDALAAISKTEGGAA